MNDESSRDEDTLIHRALSATASRNDWDALERLADTDPALWQRLGLALRDQGELLLLGQAALFAVDAIELPPRAVPRKSSLTTRSGWIAAAAMFLLWAATVLHDGAPSTNGITPSFQTPSGTALRTVSMRAAANDDVISELPKLVVDTRRVAGGVEITYLRRIFETKRVNEVLGVAETEAGEATIVPISHTLPRKFEDF